MLKLNQINIRDPFILPFENKYYMYGSRTNPQLGFDVYVSDDLENWSEPKSVFEKNENFWAETDFWAPEVHIYNNKFYMFASFKAKNKCRATHILVADRPDECFKPLSDKPATPENWECLDGTFYIDKNNAPHIVFSHEWVQIHNGTICDIELSKDLKTAVSAPRVLFSAADYKDVVSISKDENNFVTDGPYFFKCADNSLICIWASFNKNGYTELIAKSDNGDISGNWTVLNTPLSSEDGGHGMIFKTFEGKYMFVMHKPNISFKERPVILNFIESDGSLSLSK